MIKHKEIVLVRVLGNNREAIMSEVSRKLSEINAAESRVAIELFCNVTLPTDFSVHLDYYEPIKRKDPSTFGQILAEALKEFGLISHSLWTLEDR